jgi:hypothetical protein
MFTLQFEQKVADLGEQKRLWATTRPKARAEAEQQMPEVDLGRQSTKIDQPITKAASTVLEVMAECIF